MTIALREAQLIGEPLIELRRELHQAPEVGLDVPRTQEKILEALSHLPLEVSVGSRCSSITAVLRGTAPGLRRSLSSASSAASVLLRADMDALPVQERSGAEFSSRTDGAMHACGHDLHMAMLVGAAQMLCDDRDQLHGDVVFMFQPGEEGYDGASVMIDEGVLDASGRRVDAAYALHVFASGAPAGQFMTRPGTIMSASDLLRVTVVGAGGHGSAPHKAKDPVTAAAEMVTALQTMITRQFDIFDPAVLSVSRLAAGTADNVIPDRAEFTATVRTFSTTSRSTMQEAIPRLLHGIAAAHGVEAEIAYEGQYPPTINDRQETSFVEAQLDSLLDASQHARLSFPLSASEDFSRVLHQVPGSLIGLSAVAPGSDPISSPFNHSPHAIFDDRVIPSGMTVLAGLATARLELASASTAVPVALEDTHGGAR